MARMMTLVKALCFKGQKGEKGDSALSVSVGTTTTGAAGSNASVANSGTETDLVLDFTIPRGAPGVSVTNISKTSTVGNVDTYTILMSNGTRYTFTVRNGENKQAYITQAAYDALVSAGEVDPTCYYFIIDDDTEQTIEDLQYGQAALETLSSVGPCPEAGEDIHWSLVQPGATLDPGLYLFRIVDSSIDVGMLMNSGITATLFVSSSTKNDFSTPFVLMEEFNFSLCVLRYGGFDEPPKTLSVVHATDLTAVTSSYTLYCHKMLTIADN